MHLPAKEKQKEKEAHLEVTYNINRPEIYNDDGKLWLVILGLLRKLTEKSDMI